MTNPEIIVANTLKLVKGFHVLDLPVFYTEQYPKGIGPTEQSLLDELSSDARYEKLTFSCIGVEGLFESFKQKGLSQIVVCGIESHICVLQTVMDLKANGFQVKIVADAVSSRKLSDVDIALSRARMYDVDVVTVEMVLFELLGASNVPKFKAISQIIK